MDRGGPFLLLTTLRLHRIYFNCHLSAEGPRGVARCGRGDAGQGEGGRWPRANGGGVWYLQ